MYGPSNDAESIETIHEAIDSGVTLLDTGDFYGMGHNELLIRDALKGRKRDKVFIQVKFGAQRDPKGAFIGYDARPNAVKTWLTYTLTRLGTDYVDLYQPARLDPAVPIEETVGAIADLIKAGYVRHVGLSEMSADTIRRAHAVHPVTSIQMEYSLMSRSIEAEILPTLRELGIGVTAYGVFSRGLLTGKISGFAPGDFRARLPRWSPDNLKQNSKLIEALHALASEKGATPAQLAVAWVLSRGDQIVPLVGARKRLQLWDALGALDLSLSADDLKRIEQAVPEDQVAGSRYDSMQMKMLDSERSRNNAAG
jgi:aryl-alcohol dehydrogenase-like predicted oxidoreductase